MLGNVTLDWTNFNAKVNKTFTLSGYVRVEEAMLCMIMV